MRAKAGRVIQAVVCVILPWQLVAAQPVEPPDIGPPVALGETIEVRSSSYAPLVMVKPPRPKYPRDARGVSGWVRVECLVSPRGRIQSVRVVESLPAGVFDQAAIEAMKSARFKPFKSAEPRLMVQRLIFESH